MAGDGEHRSAHRPAAVADLEHVADDLSVLAAREGRSLVPADLRRSRRTDDDRVVPGQLRDRLRQLLQPAVVREAAVEGRRIVAERTFESSGWGLGAGAWGLGARGWTRRRPADVP